MARLRRLFGLVGTMAVQACSSDPTCGDAACGVSVTIRLDPVVAVVGRDVAFTVDADGARLECRIDKALARTCTSNLLLRTTPANEVNELAAYITAERIEVRVVVDGAELRRATLTPRYRETRSGDGCLTCKHAEPLSM